MISIEFLGKFFYNIDSPTNILARKSSHIWLLTVRSRLKQQKKNVVGDAPCPTHTQLSALFPSWLLLYILLWNLHYTVCCLIYCSKRQKKSVNWFKPGYLRNTWNMYLLNGDISSNISCHGIKITTTRILIFFSIYSRVPIVQTNWDRT